MKGMTKGVLHAACAIKMERICLSLFELNSGAPKPVLDAHLAEHTIAFVNNLRSHEWGAKHGWGVFCGMRK
jgi:hypothetical protein